MDECSFEQLFRFVNKQLDLNGLLEVYAHLDRCDICRDAVCQLAQDRNEAISDRCVSSEPANALQRL